MTTEDDLAIIADVERAYEREIRDFETYWYLGHRFQYHPLVGYVNAPASLETFNINSMGFRGPEYQKRNVHGNPRIGVFGPSGLVGIPNCNDGTTMTAYAQSWLDEQGHPAEVMNFGVISTRISNETRLISKFVAEFEFDAVVLMSSFNDGSSFTLGSLWEYQDIADIQIAGFDLNRRRDDPFYFLKLAGRALKRRRIVAQARKASREFRGAEKYFRRMRAKTIDNKTFTPTYDLGSRFYRQCLVQIMAVCRHANLPFVYVPQPTLFTTAKRLSEFEEATRRSQNNIFGQDPDVQRARIEAFRDFYAGFVKGNAELVEENGGRVIDADALFASMPETENVFYDESHYLEAGNRLIGEAIAKTAVTALAS